MSNDLLRQAALQRACGGAHSRSAAGPTDRGRANNELTAWIREADSSGIRILKDAARKLLIWKPFILNWHNHHISTGKLEAINCKIGTLQRNAYGYRDEEYLKLRIFNLHNSSHSWQVHVSTTHT